MIEEGLMTYLEAQEFTDLGTGANYRLFPVRAPQGTVTPYMTVEKISAVRMRDTRGPLGYAKPRFRIHVFDESYLTVKNLVTEVRQALDGYDGLMGTVSILAVMVENESDFYEEDTELHHCVLDFFITHVET